MNALLSPDLKVASLITQFRLGPTVVLRPGQKDITDLCGTQTDRSLPTATMSIRSLKIPRRSITPVHMHPNKEKVYMRHFDPSIIARVDVFIHINGEWQVFQIEKNGLPVVVPERAPHAVFTTACVEITVITSNKDPVTYWEADAPAPTA